MSAALQLPAGTAAVSIPGRSNEHTGGRRSPERARVVERDKQAVQLRLAGYDFETIAQHLGFRTRGGAWQAVDRELFRRPFPPTEALRAQELERLEALHKAHWPKAIAGDHDACMLVLRIAERRHRLMGLDRGPLIEQTTINVGPGAGATTIARIELPSDPAEQAELARQLHEGRERMEAIRGAVARLGEATPGLVR